MKRLIYADNAATTQLDDGAFEAMKPYLLNDFGNASQPYSFSRSSKAALRNARETIAACINADPGEIFFTSGGTESDNWAIKGLLDETNQSRAIITSSIEHHAVLRACATIEHMGTPVAYLFPTKDGVITDGELRSVITPNTKLVSIMLSNNELGTIQPVTALAETAHEYNAFFHTDAVQCVGHIPVDVKKLGVDMLSASAHKFNGPKGVGFLYVRSGTPLGAFMDGGSQEGGHRAGTENVANIVGMAYALERNISRLTQNMEHITKLETRLLSKLRENGVMYIRNGGPNTVPGVINLSFPGFSGEAILHRLDLLGVMVSTGSACDGKDTQVSHVLNAIGLEKEIAKGTIRISIGKNNTADEMDYIAASLNKILVKKES